MQTSLAPMEGITTYIYRRLSRRYFTMPDRAFTPYLSPARCVLFSEKEWTEITPEHNRGLTVIPQLMVHDASLCLAAIRRLQELGYTEVNLNFGCPSGNVTRKRKGAGILSCPEEMNRLLQEVLEGSPLPVSVKTRLGMHAPEEFDTLLSIFRSYPLKELILHPRVRDQFYDGELYEDRFRQACEGSPFPIVFNGEIRSRADLQRREASLRSCPCCREIMIGRGLIGRPDLLDPIPASPEHIRDFDRHLEEEYRRILPDETAVLVKMKRIMTWRFREDPRPREQRLAVLSAPDLAAYHVAYDALQEGSHRISGSSAC